MKENTLITLSKQFAVDIIALCTAVKERNGNVLLDQLLRAGTSIGANIHEGIMQVVRLILSISLGYH